MFLYTWRCTTFNISILLTNKNVPLIYSITFCQQKTKDCVPSASKLQFSFLFFLCLPPFITLSPLHNFSFEIKIGDVKSVRQKRTWIREWLFKDSCSVRIYPEKKGTQKRITREQAPLLLTPSSEKNKRSTGRGNLPLRPSEIWRLPLPGLFQSFAAIIPCEGNSRRLARAIMALDA